MGKVIRWLVKFAIYTAIAFGAFFPRVPDSEHWVWWHFMILVGALVTINIAVGSTVDWIWDTVRDAIETRRKHDDHDGSAGDSTPGDEG